MLAEIIDLSTRIDERPDNMVELLEQFGRKFDEYKTIMYKMQDILNFSDSCFDVQFPDARERFNVLAKKTDWSAENRYDEGFHLE